MKKTVKKTNVEANGRKELKGLDLVKVAGGVPLTNERVLKDWKYGRP